MNKLSFTLLGLALVALIGCTEKDLYQGDEPDAPIVEEKTSNSFDFSTSQKVAATIQYQTGVDAYVPFEVYDKNPIVEETGSSWTKEADLEPLYAGYTDAQGRFSGDITLPAYAQTVYIYTPAFYATRLLCGSVANGTLSIVEEAVTTASSRAATTGTGNHYSIPVQEEGWNDLLGEYNGTSGKVSYALPENHKLAMTKKDATSLYTAFVNARKYITDYICESDLDLQKAAEIGITLLGGNTCWNSSLGYYYYREGENFANYDAIKNRVILLCPNTQDGMWRLSGESERSWKEYWKKNNDRIGLDRGTSVQLLYFGDYDASTDKFAYETGVTKFPAGLKIGFVLAANGWSNTLEPTFGKPFTGYTKEKRGQRSATSKQVSKGYNKGDNSQDQTRLVSPTDIAKTAAYRQGEYVLVSFEDDGNASDVGKYTDVVFTTKTDPVDAIEIKKLEIKKDTIPVLKGTYCFEDLWPSFGDYDMNDAMAVYHHSSITTLYITTTTTTGSGGIPDITENKEGPMLTGESFTFTTYRNYATIKSYLGFKINKVPVGADLSNATIETQKRVGTDASGNAIYEDIDVVREGNNVFLLGGISENGENEYKVTVNWKERDLEKNGETEIDCFIYRPSNSKRLEVHVPFAEPSADKTIVDFDLFGKDLDRTIPDNENWYTGENEYPFAFYLIGADNKTLSPLLLPANEKTKISDLYPKFLEWSLSKGEKEKNWYEKP